MKNYVLSMLLCAGFVSVQAQFLPTEDNQDLWTKAVRQRLGLANSEDKHDQNCGLQKSEEAFIEALLAIVRGSL